MSPNVWFDIWVDEQHAAMLVFRLGNNGASAARNVVITIDSPLSSFDRPGQDPRDVQGSLERGITYLPPGRVMEWSLGVVFEAVANNPVRERRVSIRGEGPFGKFTVPDAIVRIDDFKYARAVPPGTLHGVTKAIDGVAKILDERRARTMQDCALIDRFEAELPIEPPARPGDETYRVSCRSRGFMRPVLVAAGRGRLG